MNPVSAQTAAFDSHLAAILRDETPAWPFADAGPGPELWGRVQFHGIAGLLAGRIGALAGWPDALRAKVREEAQVQAFWEESHRAMLTELVEELAQRGVPSLLMKGSALAYSLYAQPWTRRRGDSDLLVAEAQLGATRAVLAEQGFTRRDDPHGLFFQETWLGNTGIGLVHAVDLHWQPSDSPALQTVLRADKFFASRQPLARLSASAAMPGLVLTFLQGALNQAWHGAKGYFVGDERLAAGGRLIWAWDNHLLAGALSENQWAELAEMAIARDVAPLCLAALQLARDTLRTSVPEDILQRLRDAPSETNLVIHLNNTNRITAFFTDLGSIRSPSAKYRFVLGHALPDAVHLRRKYPRSAGWPLPLLHLRRMAESALRLVRMR